MKRYFTILLALFVSPTFLQAQMWNGTDTLYGNEWINYDQSYFKIMVAEDGMYRIPQSALVNAGIDVNAINGTNFQLFHNGEEAPIYVSTESILGANDYIEFYGEKNRDELDRYLYNNPDIELLNPEYSLFTDTSAYFLTWDQSTQTANRFQSVQNDLTNLPSPEQYFMHEEKVVFSSENIKENITNGIYFSTYGRGEGFANGFTTSVEVSLSPDHIFTGVNQSNVNIRLATSDGNHQLSIGLNGDEIKYDEPNGFTLQQYDINITTSELTGDDKVQIDGTFDSYDRHAVANVVLNYPRSFNFDNQESFKFKIKASASPLYLEIENFNAGSKTILYDLTNNIRIETQIDGNIVKVKLPPSIQERTLCLINNNSGSTQVGLQTTNFVDLSESDAEFIIISNKALFNDGNGTNWVQEYANYRSSMQGGDYPSRVIEIQQLYDQFAYGINRHSISMRNFGHYIKKAWSNPKYVFMIGKGREYRFVRTNAQLTSDDNETFYIPTFGRPGSDNLLLAGLYTSVPVIPASRIAVSDPEEIKTYLEKVQTLEANVNNPQTIEDKLWMKRVLHLGGGGPNEQATIRNHLSAMENTIENNKFGGEVTSFYKNSADPIQIGEAEGIFERINSGVSIITFFGHSAVGTFDFNIDNPEKYENYGRYPLMFSLGCYSGNIHTSSGGVSERFIFLKDKAAIAFGASVGQGYISSLRSFADKYYELVGSEEYYGEGIGKFLQETIKSFDHLGSVGIKTLVHQFTLHGDPALRLNPSPGPDYIVDINSVSFEPEVITAQMDSFSFNFSIANLGYVIEDTILVKVEQKLPSGDKLTLVLEEIPTPKFEDKLTFSIPSFGQAAAGLNTFHVTIDVNNDVEEFPSEAEFNNQLKSENGSLGVPLYIFDDSARPVYPKEFAIVNESNITLKASTSDALAPEKKYIIEIDTTAFFNSPIKASTEIIQSGGVIKWQPNINMVDSTVYYWRISPDSINAELGFIWETSSFVYLPNSEKGWNQSHYFQYLEDEYEGLTLPDDRQFSFGENGFFITIKNKVYDPNSPPEYIYDLGHGAASVRPWNFIDAGIAVVVGDSVTGSGWKNIGSGDYGSVNSGTTRVFSFPTNTVEQRETLMFFLNDIIQPKNFVFLFSVLKTDNDTYNPEAWAQDSTLFGTNLFSILEEQGATLVRNLENTSSVPYSIIYQKDVGLLAEGIASSISDEITTEAFIPINKVSGTVGSVKIGPAKSWDKLSWEYGQIDDPVNDTVFLSLYGIDQMANEVLLSDRIYTLDTSLTFIDANTYPYLKLEYNAIDKVNRTPAQLNFWKINYIGLPEVAVNAYDYFVFHNDTLQEGEQATFELAIENIGEYSMDSLLVKLQVSDEFNNEIIFYKRLQPFEIDEVQNANFEINTNDLKGYQNLVFEVNPDEDQPELYHFNNYAVKQFYVDKDKKNPLMDVTFDGVHIMDGDIVSPTPNIYISVKDENKFLALSDTSLFKVFIKYPEAFVAENISFQNDWITFFPASGSELGEKNQAYIEFKPEFEEDGVYQLLVQAEDASGNQSGEVDYKVNFEVINKSMISNVLNYPNPFSTSTQFVYTLTGSEIPEYFKIQIMTVSGKIVKEITQDEIGPLKIGTHRTDYRWDGTDDYGARLANGVYLYRVITKKSFGEDYESYNTGTNDLFKNGFGKMVIMR